MSTNAGTNVAAPIRPFDSQDTFPVAHANEILGGLHTVSLLSEMYSIPYARRTLGMLCSVEETDMVYKLINNRKFINTNKDDWTPMEGVIDLVVNGSVETTSDLNIRDGLLDGCITVNNKQVKIKGADKIFEHLATSDNIIIKEATEQDIDDMFKGQL